MSFRRRRRRRRRASGSRQAKRLHVYDRRNRHTVQAREAARGAERGTLAPTGSGLSGNCGRAPTATTTPHSPRSRSGPPTTVARLRRSCLLCTVCPAGGYARGSYPGVTRARGVARCILGGWPGTCYHRHHGIPRRVPRCPLCLGVLTCLPIRLRMGACPLAASMHTAGGRKSSSTSRERCRSTQQHSPEPPAFHTTANLSRVAQRTGVCAVLTQSMCGPSRL